MQWREGACRPPARSIPCGACITAVLYVVKLHKAARKAGGRNPEKPRMRVIVLGAGEVGFDAARMLSLEHHSVTVVDIDAAKLQRAAEQFDVLTVLGSGTSHTALIDAGIEGADLLLAVTSSDEVNIIASMIAQRLGARHAIARIRSDELSLGDNSILTSEDTGIDLIINPEESAAREVIRLVRRSCATDVVPLAEGQLQLVGVRLGKEDKVAGLPLSELEHRADGTRFRVVGIHRGVRTIIPSGTDVLRPNDQVFFLARTESVPGVIEILERRDDKMDHVMILGGSGIGRRVAEALGPDGHMQIKLVEADLDRAERLASELRGVLVIHGDPTDVDLLATEGIGEMDALLALTDNEEANLVASLMGKHIGVKKTIAMLSKSMYIPLSQSIGLDAAVNRKLSVANEIMRFLRSKRLRNVASVPGLDAEILEVEAEKKARITQMPLKDLNVPPGILVGAVYGENLLEVATGDTWILSGDRAIVFVPHHKVGDVERLFGIR